MVSLSVLSAQWMAAGSREKASVFLCVGSHRHQLRAALLRLLHLLGVRGEPAGLCRARAEIILTGCNGADGWGDLLL